VILFLVDNQILETVHEVIDIQLYKFLFDMSDLAMMVGYWFLIDVQIKAYLSWTKSEESSIVVEECVSRVTSLEIYGCNDDQESSREDEFNSSFN
jgi:hypothetical protein